MNTMDPQIAEWDSSLISMMGNLRIEASSGGGNEINRDSVSSGE